MSAVSIEQRIQAAASNDAGLLSLLRSGVGMAFRWYQNEEMVGRACPAVVTQLISCIPLYSHDGPLKTSKARVQFKIFGGQRSAGAQAKEDVGQALRAFFTTLNLSSCPASIAQPNFIEIERNTIYAQQDGVMYLKIFDLQVYVDDLP